MKEFTLTARYDYADIQKLVPGTESCTVYAHTEMEIIHQANGLCLINPGFDEFEVAPADVAKYVYASVLAGDILLENQIIEDSGEAEFSNHLRAVVEKLYATTDTKTLLDTVIKIAVAHGKI